MLTRSAQSLLLIIAVASIARLDVVAQARPSSGSGKREAASKKAMTALEVKEAEELLGSLGYWAGPVDGKFDGASRHALIAFQKVEGRLINGKLTRQELKALRIARRPTPRIASFAHIEIDLSRQVLFVVDKEGQVSRVLPISSGSGEEFTSEGWTRRAITPTGRFQVHRKVEGWRKSPLGLLYYPNYYLSGLAIHGNPEVPTSPASHGCVRIPMFAAKEMSRLTPVGTWVIVHDGGPINEEEPLPVPAR